MYDDILNHPRISENYFFPRKAHFDPVHWIEVNGAKLGCYYFNEFPKEKTLICFHGNGETVSDYIEVYSDFFKNITVNFLYAEYRGYGRSSGRPQMAKMLDDVKAIVTSIQKPIEDIVFFGRSIGSLYAVHAASIFPNAAGLIIESGIADIYERINRYVYPWQLGVNETDLKAATDFYFNQKEKIAKFKGNILLLHTQHDGLVEAHHATTLFEAATTEKAINIFPYGNHNSIYFENKKMYEHLIASFIDDLDS